MFDDDYETTVWSDCGPDFPYSGRCLGVGKDRASALREAVAELLSDIREVLALLPEDDRLAIAQALTAKQTPTVADSDIRRIRIRPEADKQNSHGGGDTGQLGGKGTT